MGFWKNAHKWILEAVLEEMISKKEMEKTIAHPDMAD